MTDLITIRGFVATDIRQITTANGVPMASFRMGSTERRMDKEQNQWVDGLTNWFSVSMFRKLAQNVFFSLKKGDRVVVVGRLRVKQWARPDGTSGTAIDIEAESVACDLLFGTVNYSRTGMRAEAHPESSNDTETGEGAELDSRAYDGVSAFDPDGTAGAGQGPLRDDRGSADSGSEDDAENGEKVDYDTGEISPAEVAS